MGWVGFSVSVTILAEMGQFSFLSVRYDSFLLGFRQLLFFFFKIKVYELTELGKRIGNLIGFLVLVNFAWILSVWLAQCGFWFCGCICSLC